MGVAVERSLWVTVGLLIAGKIPDNERFVARSRKEHVGAIQWSVLKTKCKRYGEIALLEGCSQRGDPAAVALKGTTDDELLSHNGELSQLKNQKRLRG